MAFTRSELSLMAYSGANGGHHMYFYSNTAEDTVTASGFFDPAAEQINTGDVILDVTGAVFYSAAVTDGEVTVAPMHDAPA